MFIGTWNVAGFRKMKSLKPYVIEDKPSLDYYIKQIAESDVDILCLQDNLSNETKSFSTEIAQILEFPYFYDVRLEKSTYDSSFYNTLSVFSRFPMKNFYTADNINPHWKMKIAKNTHVITSDRKYQIVVYDYFILINSYFLPEKLCGKDYTIDKGIDYIINNQKILSMIKGPFYLCGDMNTTNIDYAFYDFLAEHRMINAFDNIPTKPISESTAIINDVIFSPYKAYLIDTTIIKTFTPHYYLYAEFAHNF
jgi:exonuclease III